MQVFTGTKGGLKLRGKMLRLVKDSIPVPEYSLKLVVDSNSGASIVFVTQQSSSPTPHQKCHPLLGRL
jgi:hypothetical protein